METTGQLKKLNITAFKDVKFKDQIANGSFDTLVNPEKYTLSYAVDYNATQPAGTTGKPQTFTKIKPSDLEIQILFDATGVLGNKTDVKIADQIKTFQDMMFSMEGETHRTNYVRITWGSLIFKGCLLDVSFDYKLFNSDGEPLRVIAKTKFKSAIEDELRAAKENKSSPDLTHIRTVVAGDNLPLMTYRIYGDSKYYLEVAKFNKLANFRNLKPGTEITFPPIEKQG